MTILLNNLGSGGFSNPLSGQLLVLLNASDVPAAAHSTAQKIANNCVTPIARQYNFVGN